MLEPYFLVMTMEAITGSQSLSTVALQQFSLEQYQQCLTHITLIFIIHTGHTVDLVLRRSQLGSVTAFLPNIWLIGHFSKKRKFEHPFKDTYAWNFQAPSKRAPNVHISLQKGNSMNTQTRNQLLPLTISKQSIYYAPPPQEGMQQLCSQCKLQQVPGT